MTSEDRKAELSSPDEGECPLPNGCTLYWKANGAGGRTYISDEIGGGSHVWDTCLVDQSTLLAAMAKEAELTALEQRLARRANRRKIRNAVREFSASVGQAEYVDGAHCVVDGVECD